MHTPYDSQALATLFSEGRTHSAWLDKPVPDALLEQLYDQVRLGPTAVNSCPGRFVFVRTGRKHEGGAAAFGADSFLELSLPVRGE